MRRRATRQDRTGTRQPAALVRDRRTADPAVDRACARHSALSTLINLGNLSVQFAIIGVLAIGTTAVIICREIDLSIGATEGFCAVVAALTAIQLDLPWPLAVVAAIGAGGLIGAFNGFMVTKIGVPSFVVTLGTLGIVGGIALVLTGGQSIYGFPPAYQWIGQGGLLGIRAPLLFCGLLLIFMHFVMKHTTLGLAFYAVGGNDKAAELVGISTHWAKFLALTIARRLRRARGRDRELQTRCRQPDAWRARPAGRHRCRGDRRRGAERRRRQRTRHGLRRAADRDHPQWSKPLGREPLSGSRPRSAR